MVRALPVWAVTWAILVGPLTAVTCLLAMSYMGPDVVLVVLVACVASIPGAIIGGTVDIVAAIERCGYPAEPDDDQDDEPDDEA